MVGGSFRVIHIWWLPAYSCRHSANGDGAPVYSRPDRSGPPEAIDVREQPDLQTRIRALIELGFPGGRTGETKAGFRTQEGKAMSTTLLQYPTWQKPLLQAVLEIKPDSLVEKVQIAERAISQRLKELEDNPGSKEERLALHKAVSTLRDLKSVLIQSDSLEN